MSVCAWKLLWKFLVLLQDGWKQQSWNKKKQKTKDSNKRENKTKDSPGFAIVKAGFIICNWLATKFRCVNMTPFGNPVVPLLYGRNARSLAGSIAGGAKNAAPSSDKSVVREMTSGEDSWSPMTTRCWRLAPASWHLALKAALAVGSKLAEQMRTLEEESASCWQSSSGVNAVLAGVMTPPNANTCDWDKKGGSKNSWVLLDKHTWIYIQIQTNTHKNT